METNDIIKNRIEAVLPMLNEWQRRVYLDAESQSMGWGGKSKIAKLSSVARRTIAKGETESFLNEEDSLKTLIRKEEGGRKKAAEQQPEMLQAIADIVSPDTRGNPLIWTNQSIKNITEALLAWGYKVSPVAVRQGLISLGYRLMTSKTTKAAGDSALRDAQFEHINKTVKEFAESYDPVISVECKKKELSGESKKDRQEWTSVENTAELIGSDDLANTSVKAGPSGVSDRQNKRGRFKDGTSIDAAHLSVSTIREWWYQEGSVWYPSSDRLSVNIVGRAGNGPGNHLWRSELQQFSNESRLSIHVNHLPPGTSKWNKIEHRLFASISMNWRTKPLNSLFVIISLIGATPPTGGLPGKAKRDKRKYLKGLKVTEKEKLNNAMNDFYGEWNYVITPDW